MNEIEKILGAIDDAIAKFTGTIPGIQKLVYDELQPLMKQIQIKNGRILNNLDNLKLIGTLKNKLEKIIISADYKKSVSSFVDSFYKVSDLNNQYFAQFNSKYKAPETLKIIRELAVESTINELVGQGMKANVIDPVQKILNQNITTGGNYAKFQEEVRNHILSNDTGDGSLVRYTKQITTDAIHQYNAQYHETIAQDLQFNWGRYIGSNLTTSREFCVQLTKKQWVHKSELPQIIKGKIDEHECKLSKTTKLPLGMIPGTGADNFKVRRGGYNCGHQFFWVPDSSVPAAQLARFAKPKEKNEPVEVIPVKVAAGTPQGTPVSKQIKNIDKRVVEVVSNVFAEIDSIHGDGVLKDIRLEEYAKGAENGAFHFLGGKAMKISLSKKGDSPELTFAHEMAHYIDFEAIGKQGTFETMKENGITSDLINAINKTSRIAGIKEALDQGFYMNGKTKVYNTDKLTDHFKYLLSSEEIFARAYAQFIATKGANKKMKLQLKKRQAADNKMSIGYQWQDHEFKEISVEMEKLLVKLGWISQ